MYKAFVEIPDEVLYDTHMSASDVSRFVRETVALGYYTRNSVSIGYCAEIAGMSEGEFIDLLGANHISIFQFDNEEELMRDRDHA